ncbi:FAD-dependent monooxygenase [Streptomyces sp. MS1.HAVA.3]|uniref:FAD-dependent monooxygenase n=1 Tax=Streptomyces caledonius TaxID=3134107 RepID=A0ABU8U8Q8_9ACTN
MEAIEVPVLIVGGGGCGLSASVFLSDQGVDHLLVERHPDTSRIPKAHYLNQRTMEIFRQHGIAEDVLAEAAPLEMFGKVRWQTTLAGDGPMDRRLIHEMDAFGGGELEETYAAVGPVLPAKLPQMWLEPILRRHAEQRNPGRILFHHELTTFSDEGDHVLAELRNVETGETTTVKAQYLIGADGGRFVGPAVGIEMQGPPGLVNTTTAYFSADLSQWWRRARSSRTSSARRTPTSPATSSRWGRVGARPASSGACTSPRPARPLGRGDGHPPDPRAPAPAGPGGDRPQGDGLDRARAPRRPLPGRPRADRR